jgi:hypothetical protein
MEARDRLAELLKPNQKAVTGIDFVYVHFDQTTLDIYFLRSPVMLTVPLFNLVDAGAIRIYSPSGGERLPEVPVTNIQWVVVDGRLLFSADIKLVNGLDGESISDTLREEFKNRGIPLSTEARVTVGRIGESWAIDETDRKYLLRNDGLALNVYDGRDVLRATTAHPGDFSRYRLHIEDSRVDRFFNDVSFSFKANCASDLDCKPAGHECPPEALVDFPIDYTARDFWSFRQALLDFASQRHPHWKDRLEADVGVMLAEVMSALGDEFAYYQDRIGREAYLETAVERRSLRRLARLVDYDIHDGLGASTWLDFQVNADGIVKAGDPVVEAGPIDPVTGLPVGARMQFEVGHGLSESFAAIRANRKSYDVKATLSDLCPHQWDDDDLCLPVGSTELYINGNHESELTHFDDLPPDKEPGKWVLLKTRPLNPAIAQRSWMVRLIAVRQETDSVFGMDITRLVWEPEQATPFEMDLTALRVHANLLPATAGAKHVQQFTIGPSDDEMNRPSAIEREGPDRSVSYLFSLPGSDEENLVWLGDSTSTSTPEIRLTEVATGVEWIWRRALLGTNSAQPGDKVFTLDDGTWRRVVGYQRIGNEIVHEDYASDAGKTIRFGDGEFGEVPAHGTIFEVSYRLEGGARGNVAADTLTQYKVQQSFVVSVTNPIPARNGLDPETPEQIRQLAPDAFRALTFRAVRPEDYAEAAERLPWVQRAGAAFRWTGSWLTAFVTPDPIGAVTVTAAQGVELNNQVDRFRQAGRPAYMMNPRYANLDLEITICVAPSAYRGEVKERVLETLFGVGGVRPRSGFFSPDNFTFGTSIERSRLEAVIQEVPGVRAVEGMRMRRRGWFDWRDFNELTYGPAHTEVISVENDPLFPERGSVRLVMKGGA